MWYCVEHRQASIMSPETLQDRNGSILAKDSICEDALESILRGDILPKIHLCIIARPLFGKIEYSETILPATG
jgi:hypothetical protein